MPPRPRLRERIATARQQRLSANRIRVRRTVGLRDGVRCLVKGSRSSAMDRVVRALQGGTTPEDSHAV